MTACRALARVGTMKSNLIDTLTLARRANRGTNGPQPNEPFRFASCFRILSLPLQFLAALMLVTNAIAAPALKITTKSLPNATVGTPYLQTLSVSGGAPPYTWAVQSGGLPSLLTLNPTNGQITGMPTASGSWVYSYPFSVYIRVADANSNTAFASYSFYVVPPSNTYYQLTVNNGTGGGFYTSNTSVAISANNAPAGQAFQQWVGAPVGSPTSASTTLLMPGSNVTVTATYAPVNQTYALTVVNGTGSGSYASNASVTITANPPAAGQVFQSWTGAAVANPLSATTTLVMPAATAKVTANYAAIPSLAIVKQTLPSAVVGVPYSQALSATGGFPPYTWNVQSGALPDVLTLNSTNGIISGIATAAGSWVFTYTNLAYVVVTDSASNTAAATFAIPVVPAPNTYFTLTVSNGTGGGFYLTNTQNGISANAPAAGQIFQYWTGPGVANPNAANTYVTMPASNITVTAVYGTAPPPPPTYALTVVGGTGGGSYVAGSTVTITANTPPAGEVFQDWTGAAVGNLLASTTTIIMPAGPVTVTANFGAPIPTYSLTVVNGTGSGNFPANATVTITANFPSSGQSFAGWSGASVASASSLTTTLVMPSNNVIVTANYGFPPPAVTNVPQPIASHPRLWITPADLPRLQSWAVASNAIYSQGLKLLADKCVYDFQTQFFPGGQPNPNYPDPGDTQGYVGLISEQYMLVLAFNALIDPSQSNRVLYGQCAHDLMMYGINQAAQGVAPNLPFRDRLFPTYNRASWTSEAWPLTLDWLYDATNASGQPMFSAQDKATIRNVFLTWASECSTAETTGGDSPYPVGVLNDPSLLPGGNAYRFAANNYYQAHARLLAMMSLSIDPADDAPLNTNQPPAQLGNTLRSYILDVTGAWLYQQFAMFGDPDAVESAYNLPATASVGLASGGLPPEGMLYGDSVRSIAEELLALKTAGFGDPALSGPQIALANNAPVWSRFVTGFISSLVPQQAVPSDESYLGEVYQFASYGDVLRMFATPDMVTVFGSLSLLDRQNNDLSRLNADRWFAINAVQGGAASLMTRVQDPWTWGVQDSIFLFLLLDPSATTTDPRPNYSTSFYDPGQGRLVDRTSWAPNATMFDFRCSWESINHQQADANQFEFYRNGEWLTKGVANYDNNDNGQSSLYHNTLALHNWCSGGIPTNLDWSLPFWTNGSQWPLGLNNGDPVTYASVQANYDYAFGDATQLYNKPEYWIPSSAALDIKEASRSILWLKPDHIVIYDRATSHTAGLFKEFNLTFPNLPTANSNVITTTTPGGQHLFITSLLPADGVLSVNSIDGLLTTYADLEPCHYRMAIQDPSSPTNSRFLHVLQGTDANATPDDATLVQSTGGTPMDGAIFGENAVMFATDSQAAFTGVTYTVPANVTQHFVTGCVPGAFYNVVTGISGAGLTVTITPAAAGFQADSAGVLPLSF